MLARAKRVGEMASEHRYFKFVYIVNLILLINQGIF